MRPARILSIVLICLGLAFSGWLAMNLRAQAPAPDETTSSQLPTDRFAHPSEWKNATAQVEPLWREARTLSEAAKQSGALTDWAAAGTKYEQVSDQLPYCTQAILAARVAGDCFQAAGAFWETIACYDKAIAIGKKLTVVDYSSDEARQFSFLPIRDRRLASIRTEMHLAWLRKALTYQQAGMPAEALDTVRVLRVEFPTASQQDAVLELQAQLEGRDAASLTVAEQAAADLSKQAKQAYWDHRNEEARALADAVMAQYPNTASVVVAQSVLARINWREKRYDEARQACQNILDGYEHIAADAKCVRDAKWRIAWLNVTDLFKRLIPIGSDTSVTEADWQHAHDLCDVVRAWAPEVTHRAEMTAVKAQLHIARGEYSETLRMGDLAVSLFESQIRVGHDGSDLFTLAMKNNMMSTHQLVGIAHLKNGSPDKAVHHFTAVIDAYEDDPDAAHGSSTIPIAAGACYRLWESYLHMGAHEEMLAAEHLLHERWPDSIPAQYLEQQKLLMATEQ